MFGLSLCIQGTFRKTFATKGEARFIPVYTGNIWCTMNSPISITVYPCVYREHIFFVIFPNNLAGLSLCIQGTYLEEATRSLILRFIPVYTGNIRGVACSPLCVPVYPCVYREHQALMWFEIVGRGLSLCIQGTCGETWIWNQTDRFIPVYTGNIR